MKIHNLTHNPNMKLVVGTATGIVKTIEIIGTQIPYGTTMKDRAFVTSTWVFNDTTKPQTEEIPKPLAYTDAEVKPSTTKGIETLQWSQSHENESHLLLGTTSGALRLCRTLDGVSHTDAVCVGDDIGPVGVSQIPMSDRYIFLYYSL